MCLLARAKRQQNLRRTGSVGRKVSEPHASKSKRQQNKRSRYNRTSGKLTRYGVKSNPVLWWVEALWAWKVRSNLQQSVVGAYLWGQVAVGLSLAPGCPAALPRGCARSVSSCFPLAAAAPGSTVALHGGVGCRSVSHTLCLSSVRFLRSLGSKITSCRFCPGVRRVPVVVGTSCSTVCLRTRFVGCSWAEVAELPTYSCWFPLPLLFTVILLLISSAEFKFVRLEFQKASKCQFW